MAITTRPRLLRRPLVRIGLVVAAVLVVVAALVFEPWKLVIDQRVDEALPAAAVQIDADVVVPEPTGVPTPAAAPQVSAAPQVTAAPKVSASPSAPAVPAAPIASTVTLARGTLISHEHASSGSVRILELADGSRVLRLENLRTSNGPRLKVWLSDAPVVEGEKGWYLFDDGRHVDLGDLKGNIGSSNYPIPAGVDLDQLTSVSIWCDRFDVSFAAAALS